MMQTTSDYYFYYFSVILPNKGFILICNCALQPLSKTFSLQRERYF